MDAEAETDELTTLRRERDAAKDAEKELKKQLKAAKEQLDKSNRELTDATAELAEALEEVEALKGDLSESGDEHGRGRMIEDLQAQYDEVCDLVDCKQWEIDKINESVELQVLRAKESVREELQGKHAKELQTRDELIALLQSKVSELGHGPAKGSKEGHSTTPSSSEKGGADGLGGGSSGAPKDKPTIEPAPGDSRSNARKLTLPSLPKFNGER